MVEPPAAGGAPALLAAIAELNGMGDPPEVEEAATDEAGILPGDRDSKIDLSPEQELRLTKEVSAVLSSYQRCMPQRLRRWQEINAAYNLQPDPSRQGVKPDASRLVSEMMRSHVNIATSRIVEMVLSMNPLIKFEVWDDQASGEATARLVEEAKALETFFESYGRNEMELPDWLPMAIHRACKLGDAILYASWQEEDTAYSYRDDKGKFVEETESHAKIDVQLVANEDMIAWPIWERRIERLGYCGHYLHYSPSEFRAWGRDHGLAAKEIDEIVSGATEERHDTRNEDLRGKDVLEPYNPLDAEIEFVELWCNLVIDEERGPEKVLLYFHPQKAKILWVGKNPHNSQRPPYFKLTYWREDNSFWGSGVGHETLYPQAADSSLWNMFIDNLKVVGNNVRVIRAGSQAEAMHDQIGPGADLVTEDPKDDVLMLPLGGDLSNISAAIQSNEMRAVKGSAITPPLQGMGDPVLKSGASPSSLQMLITEAGKKFGHVDRNVRTGLSEFYGFCLELLQQYAPDGLFYEHVAEDKAQRLLRIKFAPPTGNLRKRFRISAMAPSAAANQEVMKQHLLIIYQMAMQHAQLSIAMAEQSIGQTNPAGLQKFKQDTVVFLHNLFLSIMEQHEVPGVKQMAPKVDILPTPEQQVINQLMQQLQQAQQQLQQSQQQMQQLQMMVQGGGGMPPGAPQGQPQMTGAPGGA